jgi:hypothetical protein
LHRRGDENQPLIRIPLPTHSTLHGEAGAAV